MVGFSSSASFLATLSQTERDKMQRSGSRQILIRLWVGLCQTHQDLSDLRFLPKLTFENIFGSKHALFPCSYSTSGTVLSCHIHVARSYWRSLMKKGTIRPWRCPAHPYVERGSSVHPSADSTVTGAWMSHTNIDQKLPDLQIHQPRQAKSSFSMWQWLVQDFPPIQDSSLQHIWSNAVTVSEWIPEHEMDLKKCSNLLFGNSLNWKIGHCIDSHNDLHLLFQKPIWLAWFQYLLLYPSQKNWSWLKLESMA